MLVFHLIKALSNSYLKMRNILLFGCAMGLVSIQNAFAEIVTPYSACKIEEIEVKGNVTAGLNVIKHGGEPLMLQDSDSTYISCVDARTAHPVIATPAGDIGEFLTAINSYVGLCGVTLDDKAVHDIMLSFVNAHTTPYRPFYMHTDDARMIALLNAMGVNAFPKTRPANAEAWFSTLLQNTTRYHGCGHIWYQIADPEAYKIEVELIYKVLRAFFDLMWDPATGSHMRYEVVHKVMDAHAVVIVNAGTKPGLRGSKCKDQAPPFTPRYCPNGCPADLAVDYTISGNGELSPEYDTFVFHESVAHRHRRYVTSVFFSKLKCPKVPAKLLQSKLLAAIEKDAENALHHTLEHLGADKLPFFNIEVSLENA